ncbi:MAG: LysR substrate-binding domain-containing protein [Cyclonatronaceae bacterium]
MDFTLHQLRVFGTVARHRSMTKAAKELHMTQPAVSIQVKQLQEAIGIPLIEVIGHQIYLTEAGRHLQKLHQVVSDEIASFRATVSQLKGGLEGTLTISAASTAKYFLPYLLGRFQQKYPKIRISLKVKNRDEVLTHLKNNEYDLAILTQVPDDPSVDAFPFLDNPLVICSAPDHPLSKQPRIHMHQLKNEAFIYRESGSGTRIVLEQYLQDHAISVSPVMELGTNEAVKQAIMAGIGISLISGLSLINEVKLNKISILDVQGLPVMTQWHALHKKEKRLSPVTRNFLDFLKGKDIDRLIPKF